MGATSNHYGDVANWVEKVIESCETPLQEITARKLVRLFEKKYSYLEYAVYRDLCRRLQLKLDELFFELGKLCLEEKSLKQKIKNTILEIRKIESELKNDKR